MENGVKQAFFPTCILGGLGWYSLEVSLVSTDAMWQQRQHPLPQNREGSSFGKYSSSAMGNSNKRTLATEKYHQSA